MLALAGLAGFGTAIGIHPAVGYNDAVHLAPAVCGAALYLAGLALTYRPMVRGKQPRGHAGPAVGSRAGRGGGACRAC